VPTSDHTARSRLFAPASFLESSRTADVLRAETVGGVLLLLGAAAAMVWANSPWSGEYFELRDLHVGPAVLHLDLSLGGWAADGLLAVFFFVAGLELKREFVTGELRDPRRAALPVAAAVAGMVAPALLFVAWNAGHEGLRGWAIPTATDIAFAVAVLAVISSHLPSGLRTFLLTLAVVDDLLAITVIAVFYTDQLHAGYLLLALVPLGLFAVLAHGPLPTAYLLLPFALATWGLVHASGVHATVAGVLLGFAVPVRRHREGDQGRGVAEHLEHLVRPLSAGLAVPVFAFFAAGVDVGGVRGLADALSDPIALGVVTGLILGKSVGIAGSTWLLGRYTGAELDEDLAWVDVVGLSLLAGIGFTVSLLIGELAFGTDSTQNEHAKIGVLVGSVAAALLASVLLGARNRTYRRIEERADG
jgi:Na+:H+ antiporter, NhaA family